MHTRSARKASENVQCLGSTQTQWGREYTLLWSRAARKGKGQVKLKGGERTEQGKRVEERKNGRG